MGLMLAVRLYPFGSWFMTSGTGIPVFQETFDIIAPVLVKFKPSGTFKKLERPFSPAREANFSAQIIRALLQADALGDMAYEE